MNALSEFFVRNIVIVFFLYGLAFFGMGLALVLTSQRASQFRFVKAIRPLAAFGLLHGIHEWIEMFQKIATQTSGAVPSQVEEVVRVVILVMSFLMLADFGAQLLNPEAATPGRAHLIVVGMTLFWLFSIAAAVWVMRPTTTEIIPLADVLSRYTLGIPGALLGARAMMIQQRTFRQHGMDRFGQDLVWCATALLLYGAVGQLFVRPTSLPPSTIVNSTLFMQWFGIPVQLFRALMATTLAIYMARAINVFEVEGKRRLEEVLEGERQIANENARLRLQAQEREKTLANLLHQVVTVQETERQRIARELHDVTGQSLTAIALGLRGVEATIHPNPELAVEQARQLKSFSTNALTELRQMIADLRPSQLDDLGLVATLQSYLQQFETRYGIHTSLAFAGNRTQRLPAEYEIVLFRIAQEALTNVARHAKASRVTVRLSLSSSQLRMTIEDDGQGFDVAQAALAREREHSPQGWGLLGIQERASSVGGRCEIVSQPGQGTQIRVAVPLTNGSVFVPTASRKENGEDTATPG
jgi:signal transduction histidine kinase